MIPAPPFPRQYEQRVDTAATASFIARVQKTSGEIPWSEGGQTDPWDHVESAMGLTVAGFYDAAKKAYQWSARSQLPDGSWWSSYRCGRPEPKAHKDANMSAYIAVGVLHYHLVTGDGDFMEEMWLPVERAMDFVIDLQRADGAFRWAKRADGTFSERALLTGSSSIYMSLNCAIELAAHLNVQKPAWTAARNRLEAVIRHAPHRFDTTKSRFSMDWYYPVLCGALTGQAARRRIQAGWERFAVPGWGVRCVTDRPWVTMAETAELALALAAMGESEAAEIVFGWILDKRYPNGAFWTGVTFPNGVIYTTEQTTWTAGAVLLAADSIYGFTPASRLFGHEVWEPPAVLRHKL